MLKTPKLYTFAATGFDLPLSCATYEMIELAQAGVSSASVKYSRSIPTGLKVGGWLRVYLAAVVGFPLSLQW